MDTIITDKKQTDKSLRREKIKNTVKKILMYTGIAIGSIIVIGVLYQILQFLFVGAILLIAWLGPVFPRRWR